MEFGDTLDTTAGTVKRAHKLWCKLKSPERINLDLKQVDALLKRVETSTLKDGDYDIIKAMVEKALLLVVFRLDVKN